MVVAGACFPPLLGLLLYLASSSLASSSPALLTFDPPLSRPGKFEVTPPVAQDQSRYRFVKRQNPSGGGVEEEAALLALLDIIPRTARSSGDSLVVRLFNTLDLNEDGVIDAREFESVVRMVASLNRHTSFF